MHALVTGATGLVGSYVVQRLRTDGWQVRALVRDVAPATTQIGSLGAELRAGDLLDAESVGRAAQSCDVIFHCAATVTKGGSWEVYRRLNVGGTQAVIDAARRFRARLVHLSSVAVFGRERYTDFARVIDEQTARATLSEHDFYGRSKRESEDLVLAAHRAGEVWGTAIRPCVIYGRRDRQFVPRFARLVSAGVVPLIAGGAKRFAVVHAANVADAATRAATADVAGGKAYVTANDFDVSYADFVRFAASGLERQVRLAPLPYALASVGARVASGVATALGDRDLAGRLPLTIDFLSRDNPFSSTLARRELGWAPTVTHETGVPDAFAYWKLGA